MKAQIKRAGLLVTGWFFIVVGVIGLFLPILQGLLFIFIGLLILSTEYVWAHKLLQKLRSKFPRVARLLDRAERRARGWFHRWGHGHRAPKVTSTPIPAKADD